MGRRGERAALSVVPHGFGGDSSVPGNRAVSREARGWAASLRCRPAHLSTGAEGSSLGTPPASVGAGGRSCPPATVRAGPPRPPDQLGSSPPRTERGRARGILRPEPPAVTDPPELCTHVTNRRTPPAQVFPGVRVIFSGGAGGGAHLRPGQCAAPLRRTRVRVSGRMWASRRARACSLAADAHPRDATSDATSWGTACHHPIG
jgi:hypothetical protein